MPQPATLEWPAYEAHSRSEAMAYAALSRAWGANYEGTDVCAQAEALGLRCRTARGGLAELRQFNRPVVLLMRDDKGREFLAVLIALEDKTATFVIGAETRKVALGVLAVQWAGQYSLLWRMAPQAHENIRLGERGPAVQWLINQLAQGLIPDGLVGPQTLMRLASVGDPSAPELLPRQGGR